MPNVVSLGFKMSVNGILSIFTRSKNIANEYNIFVILNVFVGLELTYSKNIVSLIAKLYVVNTQINNQK